MNVVVRRDYVSVKSDDSATTLYYLTKDGSQMRKGDMVVSQVFERVDGSRIATLSHWRDGTCFHSDSHIVKEEPPCQLI